MLRFPNGDRSLYSIARHSASRRWPRFMPRSTNAVGMKLVEKRVVIAASQTRVYELLTDDLRPGRPIEGVTLLPEDADALAEVFADCLDVEQLMEREIISRLDMKAARKRVATRCVRRIVATDDVVRTLSLEFQSANNPVFQELLGELKRCLR